jgi:trimeric autotransporter adhesin
MTSGFVHSGNTTKGGYSTAVGFEALASALGGVTSGIVNDAFGNQALAHLTTGVQNVGIGAFALFSAITGDRNTAVGEEAGIAITGSRNICIGQGVNGVAGQDNTIRIGDNLPTTPASSACFIGGISGQGATGGATVFVTTAGKLGTLPSSARFKTEIKPMDKASEAILALKPITFRYKQELDPEGIRQFGLVAEEVEKVNRDLVVRDKEGKPYTVRYDQVNAMLLNEFLKEHYQVQDLKATVAQQQKQIEALTAGLQRVTAQVEMSKPAPQMAVNDSR